MYSVKEIFYTLQGEGANSGRPAVFCRFVGCNLWSGREVDRERAVCQFCDTNFIGTDGEGGGRFSCASSLADRIEETWLGNEDARFVVFTGGEPSLQLDTDVLEETKRRRFVIAVETNGTIPLPDGIDWVCVSPKAGARLVVLKGHELKLVYPQPGIDPRQLETLDFERFYLQPMDGRDLELNTRLAVDYCLKNPKWSLSIQTHKILGLP